MGPRYGYFPKATKTWLIVKPGFEEKASKLFPELKSQEGSESIANITTEGRKYLGSFIGSDQGKRIFIEKQMESWITDIKDLARIAGKEPQLAYAAYVYGTSKRWNYMCRTTPDISQLLKPLEYTIKETFIPAVIGREFIDQNFRDMISLPAKLGGMSILNVLETSDREYNNSIRVTEQLTQSVIKHFCCHISGKHHRIAVRTMLLERFL